MDIITKAQSGFTPGDSAVVQLVDLYDTFCRALDDGKEVRVVFCDISKAFDRVWHRGLLFKLKKAGVSDPLIKWISKLYQNSFLIQTIKDGNALPDNVKLINSNMEFKRYLCKDTGVTPPYMYFNERRCQILHTRLRLGCSSLNSDLFKNR